MKRLIIATLLLMVSAAQAFAVTVTFSVGPTTFTTNITAGSANRLATWAAGAYPTIPNPDCIPNPSTCSPAMIANPTPGVSALGAVWQGIIDNIRNSEKATGIKAVPDPTVIN